MPTAASWRKTIFTSWAEQSWQAVWPNPINGEEALHFASYVFAVEGMAERERQTFVDRLIERMTGPDQAYSHAWRPGDILVWDERATLHRGQPWPYEEARALSTFIASAGAVDALENVRP